MFEGYHDDNFKSDEEIYAMPIYKKASEILELSRKIGTLVSKDDLEDEDEFTGNLLEQYATSIINNALIIPAKIAGAEGGDLFDIRMENATLIRMAAKDILNGCTGLQLCGYKNDDFLQLLRDEIEAFRILFAHWVQSFSDSDYLIDRWGLFNPPGVNFDDYDPADDMPF